jgi:hypothetical protein
MEDSVREKLLGRLLTVISRVGGQKRALVKLYQTLQTLPIPELQQKVAELEEQVGQFMATTSSPARFLVLDILYGKFAGESNLKYYRDLPSNPQVTGTLVEAKSVLNSIAQGIISEARITILPRLLVHIDWLVSSIPSITSSPLFIILKTLVEVIVRIANSPITPKISLFSLIDYIEFKSHDLFQTSYEPAEQVYSISMLVFENFGLSLLQLYPALAQSLGWSAERARAIDGLVQNFCLFGVSLRHDFYDTVPPYNFHGHIFEDRVKKLISQASDANLIYGADLVSRLLKAHWRMQANGIFIEPLVNPAVWLLEYARDSGPSRFASWVSATLPPPGIIEHARSENPLRNEDSGEIKEFFGLFPSRFIDMSKQLSSIHEIYDDELGLIPRKTMREIVMLPSAVMLSEVRWGMMDAEPKPDDQLIQSLIEDTSRIIIDAIKVVVESTPSVDAPIRIQVMKCFEVLGSFLKAELLPNRALALMERIYSESNQVRSSATHNILLHERLCEL